MPRKKKVTKPDDVLVEFLDKAPDHSPYGYVSLPPTDVCARIMQALWRAAVLKRMQGAEAWPMVDGRELILALEPDWQGGIPFYRLENYRTCFKWLEKNGWLKQGRNPHTRQHGFGNDEGFWFTENSKQVILGARRGADIEAQFYAHFVGRIDSDGRVWFRSAEFHNFIHRRR